MWGNSSYKRVHANYFVNILSQIIQTRFSTVNFPNIYLKACASVLYATKLFDTLLTFSLVYAKNKKKVESIFANFYELNLRQTV